MPERVTLRRPDDFITVVDILKDITDECVFTFNKNEIKVITFDSGLSCLSDIVLTKPYSKVALNEEKSIGLNLKDFYNKLKLKKEDDTMILTFNDNTINIKFQNPEKKKSSSSFKMKLLNIDEVDVELDLDFSNNISMSSSYFSKIINDIKRFGDEIILSGNKETVDFKSGEDDVCITCSDEDEEMNSIENETEFDISFLLKFFISIKKAEKITDNVLLNLEDSENPLIIKYDKKNTKIHFIVSPRIRD